MVYNYASLQLDYSNYLLLQRNFTGQERFFCQTKRDVDEAKGFKGMPCAVCKDKTKTRIIFLVS